MCNIVPNSLDDLLELVGAIGAILEPASQVETLDFGHYGYLLAVLENLGALAYEEHLAGCLLLEEGGGYHAGLDGVHLPVGDVHLPDVAVVELELVRGLEGDPVHEELAVLVDYLPVEQPGHHLVDQDLVELLQNQVQNLPDPDIAGLVAPVHLVHHSPSPQVVAGYEVDQPDQLGEDELVPA